jgi:glucosylceramidase
MIFLFKFRRFLDEYKKHNVSIWGLTVENEPGAGYVNNYAWNSLGFSPELERDFIKLDLGPALEKAGYGANHLNLMINDDHRPGVHHWAQVIFKDKDAAKYVAGTAFHWYQNNQQNIVELDKTHEEFPNYFLLNTEACEWHEVNNRVSLGNWSTFDRYAYDIITVSSRHLIGI